MPHPYHLADVADIPSPALVFFPDVIRRNIAAVVAMAGGPHRLRPHVKTHKTVEIARFQLAAGVVKHKCATIAEAELLAMAGVPDVLIAYPLVGPNVRRLIELTRKFPGTHFSSLVDHPVSLAQLAATGEPLRVFVDVNVGMNRTGAVPELAEQLYRQAAAMPTIRVLGLHGYDGQNNMESRAERDAGVSVALKQLLDMRNKLGDVPALVCGGTPNFPVYAGMTDVPGLECSPGTYVLHDHGYGSKYPDLGRVSPAAVLVTRVVSRPTPHRVTFDLGTKAVASDPPMSKRVQLLDFPEHTPVGHNEEHYIVETAEADRFRPGDVAYALPAHICPTVALYKEALIAEEGRIVGAWSIVGRDRKLTV